MSVRNQNRLTFVALGVLVSVLTGVLILVLPAPWVGLVSFVSLFAATCFGIWLGWRKGLDAGEMISFGGVVMLSVMLGSMTVAMCLLNDRLPITDSDPEAYVILALFFAPLLALFVPLTIAQYNRRYPERLQGWLTTSQEAKHRYLTQLVKEAERDESIARRRLNDASQDRKCLEKRLEELTRKVQSVRLYR